MICCGRWFVASGLARRLGTTSSPVSPPGAATAGGYDSDRGRLEVILRRVRRRGGDLRGPSACALSLKLSSPQLQGLEIRSVLRAVCDDRAGYCLADAKLGEQSKPLYPSERHCPANASKGEASVRPCYAMCYVASQLTSHAQFWPGIESGSRFPQRGTHHRRSLSAQRHARPGLRDFGRRRGTPLTGLR